jgi:hypothetical protein
MIAHGLTERRHGGAHANGCSPQASRSRRADRRKPEPTPPLPFAIAERDIRRWQTALAHRPDLTAMLARQRGWTEHAIGELELGLDQLCQRITIPIRDHTGALQGLLRYDPSPTRHGRKMRAAPGIRLGLIPNPDRERSARILLVEGPPDMIAARSQGLPAIAVPGTSAWKPEWARQLAGRHVTVIMDCDPAGRHAAVQIAADLRPLATVRVVDLDPGRQDGYDLTDRLLQRPHGPLAPGAPLVCESQPEPYPFLRRQDVPTSARAI